MTTTGPPNRIVIDFLEGVTNRADAIAYARGFITSHFDVPEISGYYVQAYKGGYAYEVHEGGWRKAFLPGILKLLEDNPSIIISVRSGSRVLQVSKSPRGNFNSILLPEELSSYLENVIEPDILAPSLTAFQTDSVIWLFSGAAVGLLGGLIFILCLAFYALDPNQAAAPRLNVTAAEQLPLTQWQGMISQLNGQNYIAAMRFQGNQWHFETKLNSSPGDGSPGSENAAAKSVPEGPVILPEQTPAAAPLPPPSATGLPPAKP